MAVTVRDGQTSARITGDYLVCAMNAALLRRIPVTPTWPEAKQFADLRCPVRGGNAAHLSIANQVLEEGRLQRQHAI